MSTIKPAQEVSSNMETQTVYWVARTRLGKIEYLSSGPYVYIKDANERIEAMKYSQDKYAVVEQQIEVKFVGT